MKRVWIIILAAISLLFVAQAALIGQMTSEADLYHAAAGYRRPATCYDGAEERGRSRSSAAPMVSPDMPACPTTGHCVYGKRYGSPSNLPTKTPDELPAGL